MATAGGEEAGTPGDGIRRRRHAVLAAATAAVVLLLTLLPAPSDPTPLGLAAGEGPLACLICGQFGTADFLRNMALFVPLGLLVHLAAGERRGPVLALLAGLALSAVVEGGQLLVPGRFSTLGDLVANVAGAGVGALAARWRAALLRPPPGLAGRMSLAAGAAAGAAFLFTGWALGPAPTADRIWVQWTPELGQYEAYRGRVLEARLGGVRVGPGRMEDLGSDLARRVVRTGGPVSAVVRLGPPPSGVAPILSLFDARQRENLLLGQDGDDLVLRIRYRADALRLARPELRYRRALAGRAVGDTVRLAAWRPAAGGERDAPRRDGACLAVDGAARCGLGFPPGRGWSLLAYPEGPGSGALAALDALWAGLLLLPLGFWGVGRPATALGAGLALGGLAAAPALTPLLAPGAPGLAGLLAGVVGGRLLRRRVDRGARRPSVARPPPPG